MILVDKREKNSLVVAELVELGSSLDLKHLDVADYVIGEIAIERKTVSDFISSMLNKRLLRQLEEIKQYPKPLLLIEGIDEEEFYDDNSKEGINANAIRGMLLSVALNFQIPMIFTKDYKDTARFIRVLEKRLQKPAREISLRVKKRTRNIFEQQEQVIEGFPGIGPALAKEILKKFRTIKKFSNAEIAELSKIKKLGKKKAELIKNILNYKYKSK